MGVAAYLLLAGAYVATRLWGLTDNCLWFDEIYSVHAAEHPWNELLHFVALDLIHPPLFYVILKIWIALGGESLFWLRLLPVGFSILAIVPLRLISGELRRSAAVLLALSFLTVNGQFLKYSQEVRMYSMLMCVSLFSFWLFVRYLNKSSGLGWLLAVNIVLVWTHYFGWFVVASEIVATLILDREKGRRILAMAGVTAATFVPWGWAVLSVARSGDLAQNIGWMSSPGPREIGTFLLDLIEPFYYQASTVEPVSTYIVSIPLLLIAVAVISVSLSHRKWHVEDERRSFTLLSIFILLPIVTALLLSWLLPYSVWGTRHLIIVFAPVSLLLAQGIMGLRQTTLRVATIILIALFAGYSFVQWAGRPAPNNSWCAWGELAVNARDQGATTLYVFEDLAAYHAWFAVRDGSIQIAKVSGIDGITEDHAYFLPRGFDEVKSTPINDLADSTIWIAFRDLRENELPLRNFILQGYQPTMRRVTASSHENLYLVKLEK
jgi:mannosyltransferase